jgi:hypothetical protein
VQHRCYQKDRRPVSERWFRKGVHIGRANSPGEHGPLSLLMSKFCRRSKNSDHLHGVKRRRRRRSRVSILRPTYSIQACVDESVVARKGDCQTRTLRSYSLEVWCERGVCESSRAWSQMVEGDHTMEEKET